MPWRVCYIFDPGDTMKTKLSFVVPFFNEKDTLNDLHSQIKQVVESLTSVSSFELILIDDGSNDGSTAVAQKLAEAHQNVTLIELRGNWGKSAALAAGFAHSKGDVVFTLDADLQDDPSEIPRFLDAMDEGYDVVSGYKQTRHDPWHKVIPSRIFNAMVRALTGIPLHDVNCGFKAYRAEVLRSIRLYGELHRFVPVLAHWKRFRVGEIVVQHHPRRFGQSKFGVTRMYRGYIDLLTVVFLMRFQHRPAHFFGLLGSFTLVAGLSINLYLTALKLLGEPIGHRPLLILGVLLMVLGAQVLAFGLIAELVVHLNRHDQPYIIRGTSDAAKKHAESLVNKANQPS